MTQALPYRLTPEPRNPVRTLRQSALTSSLGLRFGSAESALIEPILAAGKASAEKELPWLFKKVARVTQPLWKGDHSIIDRIDGDPIFELAVTDIGGMVVPRAGIEWVVRNFNMARETFLREIDGTFNLLVLPGFLNKSAISVFNRVPLLNPKRMYMGAWAEGEALSQLGRHAEAVLNDPALKHPAQIRERFIHNVLEHLRVQDHQFLTQLTEQAGESHATALHQPLKDGIHGFKQGVEAGHIHDPLAEKELHNIRPVAQWFQHHTDPYQGMARLDELAQQQWRTLSPGQQAKTTLASLRQKISQEMQPNKRWLHQQIKSFLVDKGFSNGATLLPPPGVEAKPVSLKLDQLITNLDSFLQQYLDPVLAHPETGKIGEATLSSAQKQAMLHRLAGDPNAAVTGPFGKFLPHKNDGLIPYSHKSQVYLTAIPLVLTFVAAYSFPKLNNYITQLLNHGKSYFPGAERATDIANDTPTTLPVPSGSLPVSKNGSFKSGSTPPKSTEPTQVWGIRLSSASDASSKKGFNAPLAAENMLTPLPTVFSAFQH